MSTHWLLLVPFAVIAAGVIYLAVTPVNGLPSSEDEPRKGDGDHSHAH